MAIKKYSSGSWVTVPYRKYETATDTITSLPKTIIGDGTAMSAYTIKGNMVQSGTPTPSNPVYPTEVGEKTATLFSGQSSQFDSQGGTGTAYNYFKIDDDFTLTIKAKNAVTTPNDYYFGLTANGGNASGGYTWVIASNASWAEGETRTVKSSNNNYHCISFYPKNQNVFDWLVENFEVMLNEGNTALPYQPYGYKIPILSNGVSYPIYLSEPIRKIGEYADTINSDGTVTRNIYKLILTGAETGWRSTSGVYLNQEITPDYLRAPNKNTLICTHYQSINQVSGVSEVGAGQCSFYKFDVGGVQRMYFKDINISSTDAFKQYLADQYTAGTPVTVWYILDRKSVV